MTKVEEYTMALKLKNITKKGESTTYIEKLTSPLACMQNNEEPSSSEYLPCPKPATHR